MYLHPHAIALATIAKRQSFDLWLDRFILFHILPEKLGDRPRDCASNLHNIRLFFANNVTFRDGHFGDRPQISGVRHIAANVVRARTRRERRERQEAGPT